MKKKIIIILIIILIIMLIPFWIIRLKDGGTVEYKAILYEYTKIHRINPHSQTGYEDGWKLKILGINIAEKTNITTDTLPILTSVELNNIYKAVANNLKKYRETNEYNNFSASYVDNNENRVVVELIDNSQEKQLWFRNNIYDSQYLLFKQGGPNYTQNKKTLTELNTINDLIIKYFNKDNIEYDNLSYNYVDESKYVVSVGLIENNHDRQNEFFDNVFKDCCSIDYIKYIKDNSMIEFHDSKYIFEAIVLSIKEDNLTVKVLKDSNQFKKNEKVIVKKPKRDNITIYKVNNKIKITFNGNALQSNPAQIGAYKIEIIN